MAQKVDWNKPLYKVEVSYAMSIEEDYERLFTKKKLEQARTNNKWLDSIIKIFE